MYYVFEKFPNLRVALREYTGPYQQDINIYVQYLDVQPPL